MAYNEALADRLMAAMDDEADVSSRKMFGGFAVMWRGNMLCGVIGDDLMIRCGPDQHEVLLHEPGAGPMEFTGKSMKGMLTVAGASVADEDDLENWVERCKTFVGTLPAK